MTVITKTNMLLVSGAHLFVALALIYPNKNAFQVIRMLANILLETITKSAEETVALGNKQTIEYNKLYYWLCPLIFRVALN